MAGQPEEKTQAMTARAPARARRAALAVGLLIAVAAAVYWIVERRARVGFPGEEGAGVVHLDLSSDDAYEGGGIPVVLLPPAARVVEASFFPPARPRRSGEIQVTDGAGRPILDPAPLPGLDALGRATLRIPAAALPASGPCRVVLRVVTAEGRGETYVYPFEVRRTDGP